MSTGAEQPSVPPTASFFVGRNSVMTEALMDADTLMKSNPDYYRDRFQAIADLRASDDGSDHKGQEFRRVASFVNVPVFLAEKLANPDFLKDKKKFYAFIDRNPQYVTYQRRNGGRGTHRDELAMPLKSLGLDYPGAPETIEGWDAHEYEPEVIIDPTEAPTTTPSIAEDAL